MKMIKGIKGQFSKPVLVGLAVLLALGIMGVSYAARSDKLHIKGPKNHPIVTQSCSDPFTWVVSNDDGHEDTIIPYGIIDPGDTEFAGDPGSYPAPLTLPGPGDPFPRYDKDVAITTAQIESDPQYITVVIDNAYPYYYPTVFFAFECPDSVAGVIQDIVIVNDYPAELTVNYSGIAPLQEILAGEEAVGALHILVNQAAAQNASYTISLSITTLCQDKECGTAYAYHEDYATCFLDMMDIIDTKSWGWSDGPLGPGSYEFDIYASAGKCDTSKGKLAGTLTVDYDGSTATVTYDMNPGFAMESTHLYVGSEPLPRKNGDYTVSPGQYPYKHDALGNAITDTYTVTGLSGDIYVVAHAVACWLE